MAHELAGALQQAGRIRQRCAVKEPHVYMRSEYIDVAEGRIAQTCNRTAVMQDLPDFVPHFRMTSNHSCAMAPNSPPCSFIHASMAGSRSTAPLNRSNSVSHRRSIFAFGIYVTGPPTRGTKEIGPQKRRCCRECF